MRKNSPLTENDEKHNRVLVVGAGGLIGVSLIILQVLLATTSPDIPQLISLIAFSFSIPLLTCFIILKQFEFTFKVLIDFWHRYSGYSFIVSVIVTAIGVNGAIWHVSWIAGLVFLSVSIFALSFFIGYFIEEDFNFKDEISAKRTDAKESQK